MCHAFVMSNVPAAPSPSSAMAQAPTARGPIRSITRPRSGPASPNRIRLIETARPMVARFQPNSASKGRTMIPGTDRTAAAVRRQTKVTPRTTHA